MNGPGILRLPWRCCNPGGARSATGVLGLCTRCEACEKEAAACGCRCQGWRRATTILAAGAAALYRCKGCVRTAVLRMKNGGRACYAGYFAAEAGAGSFWLHWRKTWYNNS